MVRVGVVGYGTMGQVHSQALQSIPGAELVVVADPDPERQAQAQRDYGVDTVGSIEELLQAVDVDLVDICTPTYLHASIFQEARKAGKHIFCEKPLARTLEEGERLVELSAGYGQKIGIAHVLRFTPAYVRIRESVVQGRLGKVAVARTSRGGSQFPRGWHDWFADFDLSGGVILDLAVHDIDYLRWLFGDVQRVYAQSTRGRTSAQLEWAFIVLRFKSGVIAHVEAGWSSSPGEFHTAVEIAGEKGLVDYDSRRAQPIALAGGAELPLGTLHPYYLELQDMIEAIRGDRPPLVTVEDAFQSLKVTLAALESAQTGRVVEL